MLRQKKKDTYAEMPTSAVANRQAGRRRYRLAIVATHPIQYFVPFYRRLSEHPTIDVTVYYGSPAGVVAYYDPGFGQQLQWDIDLLTGYRWYVLRNWSLCPSVSTFWGLINPGLIRELARHRYDAVLVHGYRPLTLLLAIMVSRFVGSRLLYRSESSLSYDRRVSRSIFVRWGKRIGLRTLFRFVDGFLFIGSLNREFYLAYGAEPSRMFFVPYAVDNDFFAKKSDEYRADRENLRAQAGLPEDAVIFLFAAKMTHQKRPLELLEAFREARARVSAPMGLLMLGEGPLRREAEHRAKQWGLLDAVRFVGFVNQSELPRYYAIADALVRPDGVYKGDWGLTINEAMASGLAIVATDAIGATVDLVRHGENGFVVPFGDLEALADALARLALDPATCHRMGRRSRELIQGWSYDEGVRGVVAALDALVKKTQ